MCLTEVLVLSSVQVPSSILGPLISSTFSLRIVCNSALKDCGSAPRCGLLFTPELGSNIVTFKGYDKPPPTAMAKPINFNQVITTIAIVIASILINGNSKVKAAKMVMGTRQNILSPFTLITGGTASQLEPPVSRVLSDFKITAMLKYRPRVGRAGMSLTVMSFVVKDEDLSQELSDNIIECLSLKTSTKISDWGLYNVDQFAANLIQAEYFAFVGVGKVGLFRTTMVSYLAKKQLLGCVRNKFPLFGSRADIIYGRRVTEVTPWELREVSKRTPAWAVGVIVGLSFLCATLLAVWISIRQKRIVQIAAFNEDFAFQFDRENCCDRQETLRAAMRAIAYSWR